MKMIMDVDKLKKIITFQIECAALYWTNRKVHWLKPPINVVKA